MSSGVPFVFTNVHKGVIVPYDDKEFSKPDPLRKPFILPINPEKFSQNHTIRYNTKTGHANDGTIANYHYTPPEDLTFSFVLDGTGTVEGYVYGPMPVYQQIEKLKDTVYEVDPEKHRPPFVKVVFGRIIFKGCLTKLDIKYTLFNLYGDPLRATLTLTFKSSMPAEKTETLSPDLTRILKKKDEDRLDIMVHEAYNSAQYLLQVAKANSLTSLRGVKAGTDIKFPPIDKKEL